MPQLCKVTTRGVKDQCNSLDKGKNLKRPNGLTCKIVLTCLDDNVPTNDMKSGLEALNDSDYHSGN